MLRVVNGVEKELALTDFVANKLSDRLGLMEFNDYQISKKSVKDYQGEAIDITVYAVKCTNYFNYKQITVLVDYNTSNKVALEELKGKTRENALEKVFLDFENVVVGHYVGGGSGFAQLIQTYKAEKTLVLDRKQAEEILRATNTQKPVDPAQQVKQSPPKQ